LFHGGNPPSQDPYLTIVGDSLWHIDPYPRVLGDINGDGYVDWYLNADSTANPESYGYAFFYFGGPNMTATPNLVWPYTAYWQGFLPIGDFNGDSYDDLLFADDWNEHAAIYLGGNPLDTIPDYRLPWGGSAGVCNLNGDAYADLEYVIAQTDEITFLLGSSNPDTVPDYRWEVAGIPYPVGDLNGDGYDDLASSVGNGTILIRYGGVTLDTTVDVVLNFVPMNVPNHLLRAGDLNHDGYQDLLCIDYSPDPNGSWVTIHMGGPSPNPQPAFTLDWRDPPYNWMPFEETAALGDVDGDSVDDFMVTAVEGSGFHRGVAVIYGGQRTGASDPRPPIAQQLIMFVNLCKMA
jgi:hypothetical protein